MIEFDDTHPPSLPSKPVSFPRLIIQFGVSRHKLGFDRLTAWKEVLDQPTLSVQSAWAAESLTLQGFGIQKEGCSSSSGSLSTFGASGFLGVCFGKCWVSR